MAGEQESGMAHRPRLVVIEYERIAACDLLARTIEIAIEAGEFHKDSIYGHMVRTYQQFMIGAPFAPVPSDAIGFACLSKTPDKVLTHTLFPSTIRKVVQGGEVPNG